VLIIHHFEAQQRQNQSQPGILKQASVLIQLILQGCLTCFLFLNDTCWVSLLSVLEILQFYSFVGFQRVSSIWAISVTVTVQHLTITFLMLTVCLQEHFTFRSHLCITFELLSINLYEFIKQNNFAGLSLQLIKRFAAQMLVSLRCSKAY
jgi:hypothetical protein